MAAVSGIADKRFDQHGELRLIAYADGHVMYRRPGRATATCTAKEWDAKGREPYPAVAEQSSIRPDDEA